MFNILVISLIPVLIRAECPNACSGNGICGAFDTCSCFKNWMANDCSQRICQFGISYVDSPVGNMDMSLPPLSSAAEVVAVNSHLYPYGVTEQYPNMVTSAGTVLSNTAHAYAECSNRGYCDRDSGTCVCLDGFEGSACGRASCPSATGDVCSGHGVCYSSQKLAKLDNDNIYRLWDHRVTQGCYCDPGYYGPDCSMRKCPIGFDPIYAASPSRGSRRYSAWTYTLHVPSAAANITGQYAIRLIDVYGEDWKTNPINHSATCAEVIAALEDLPNSVIPDGSVRCLKQEWGLFRDLSPIKLPAGSVLYGVKYSLALPQNPGTLRPITIDKYLDLYRPTLYSTMRDVPLETFVYPENGVSGEFVDHFNDRCEGVLFKLQRKVSSTSSDPSNGLRNGPWTVLYDLTQVETIRLKRCLSYSGGGAGNTLLTDNFQDAAFDWETGSIHRPHVVRIVPLYGVEEESNLHKLFSGPRNKVKNELTDGYLSDDPTEYLYDYPGFLAALVYDLESEEFRLFNRYDSDTMGGGNPNTQFAIQTTEGELVLSSDDARVVTSSTEKFRYTDEKVTVGLFDRHVYLVASNSSLRPFYKLPFVDCENFHADHSADAHSTLTKSQRAALMLNVHCIEKGDMLMFFDASPARINPSQLPLYRVDKISRLKRDKSRSVVEIKLNMGFTSYWNEDDTVAGRAYIFRPAYGAVGSYEYAAQCSGRGHCDASSGLCECFTGYVGASCSVQGHVIK